MRSILKWKFGIEGGDRISSLCYSPDGSNLIVACGERVYIYNSRNGNLIRKLPSIHKDTVYCVAYSPDGETFASGGSDHHVVLYSKKGDPKLKYDQNASIQALAFNPLTSRLASCSNTDVGFYSPQKEDIPRVPVKSKVLCCSWSANGLYLAVGHFNGQISIFDSNAVEKVTIQRESGDPIWTLSWNPNIDEGDILAVGCWDQTLSFYHLTGKQAGKDRKLGYDPCQIDFFRNGEYMMIGGSNGTCSLWKGEGIEVGPIEAEEKGRITTKNDKKTFTEDGDWIWSVAQNPVSNHVCVGTEKGEVICRHLLFSLVHALFGDFYVYRDCMTDAIVRDLKHGTSTRIRCRGCIHKLSVYKDKLAIQLANNRCNVYRISRNAETDEMEKELQVRIINRGLDGCLLIVMLSNSIVLTQKKHLELYKISPHFIHRKSDETSGEKEIDWGEEEYDHDKLIRGSINDTILERGSEKVKEWHFSSTINYVKCVGGPVGKECLAVGLRNGEVHLVYVHHHFPVFVVRHGSPIRVIDLSRHRDRLAVVDEKQSLKVYDLSSLHFGSSSSLLKSNITNENPTIDVSLNKEPPVLFSLDYSGEKNKSSQQQNRAVHLRHHQMNDEQVPVNTVAFNQDFNDMFVYCTNHRLYVKTDTFRSVEYTFEGIVVSFRGSQVYGLHVTELKTMDIPHSASLRNFLRVKDFEKAYLVGCLGVTEEDWRELAFQCLLSLQLDLSLKCFLRLRNLKFVELIHYLKREISLGKYSEMQFLGVIFAWMRQFQRAKECLIRDGSKDAYQRGIDIFTSLKMWKEAKDFQIQFEEIGPKGSDERGGEGVDLVDIEGETLEDDGFYKEAFHKFILGKKYKKALNILVNHFDEHSFEGWQNDLFELLETFRTHRNTNKGKEEEYSEEIEFCINFLKKYEKKEELRKVFEMFEDWTSLLSLMASEENWEGGIKLLEEKKEFLSQEAKDNFYRGHSSYLISIGKFRDAIEVFIASQQWNEVCDILQTLVHNAIEQRSYGEASSLIQKLMTYTLIKVDAIKDKKAALMEIRRTIHYFSNLQKLSVVYYAYECIHQYTTSPFVSTPLHSLFHSACFLLNSNIQKKMSEGGNDMSIDFYNEEGRPIGISRVTLLSCLARVSVQLKQFDVAQYCYSRLNSSFRMDEDKRMRIENEFLKLSAQKRNYNRNYSGKDRENRNDAVVCFKCGFSNHFLIHSKNSNLSKGGKGKSTSFDHCQKCGNAFVRCLITFEVLPLIPFKIEDKELFQNVEGILNSEHQRRGAGGSPASKSSSNVRIMEKENVQELDFGQALQQTQQQQQQQQQQSTIVDGYETIKQRMMKEPEVIPVVEEELLKKFRKEDVFIVGWGHHSSVLRKKKKFFVNVFSKDIQIRKCWNCNSFFKEKDLLFELLKTHEKCPVCGVLFEKEKQQQKMMI